MSNHSGLLSGFFRIRAILGSREGPMIDPAAFKDHDVTCFAPYKYIKIITNLVKSGISANAKRFAIDLNFADIGSIR